MSDTAQVELKSNECKPLPRKGASCLGVAVAAAAAAAAAATAAAAAIDALLILNPGPEAELELEAAPPPFAPPPFAAVLAVVAFFPPAPALPDATACWPSQQGH